MPYTFAHVSGRIVLDQHDRLLGAFSNAFDAIAFAAAVNAGDIEIPARAA